MKQLSRTQIIEPLVSALEKLDFVNAMWEAGSKSFNRVDEMSDIDLMVDAGDGQVDKVFERVEETLSSLSRIEQIFEIPKPAWHGMDQKFYKLENASKYHLIDFAVVQSSKPNKFLEPQVHGHAHFYFDKVRISESMEFDENQFREKLQKRRKQLISFFTMFQVMVEKELLRGNYTDALGFYFSLTLQPLVELKRMQFNPYHHNFGLRYLSRELPPEQVKEIEFLYSVSGIADLKKKHKLAVNLFTEMTAKS